MSGNTISTLKMLYDFIAPTFRSGINDTISIGFSHNYKFFVAKATSLISILSRPKGRGK